MSQGLYSGWVSVIMATYEIGNDVSVNMMVIKKCPSSYRY